MKPAATARFEDKREAILDGAARLFNEQGVRGGMLSELAARVGLATNSLTYYYRKKEDLAAACLMRSMEALGAAADDAAREDTLARRVQGFLERYFGLLASIAEGRHAELIGFSDLLGIGEPHRATVRSAYNQMFRRVRQLLDASDAPALGPAARNARAHLLLSLTAASRHWLAWHDSRDFPRLAERLAELLFGGLCASDHAPSFETVGHAALDALDDGTADATRIAYLRAASRLVNEQGCQGASVDRIAAELRLTKGSFYHHHETKEELVLACFERTFAIVRAAQDAALAAPGSALDRLASSCHALLGLQLSDHGPLLRITAWTGLPEPYRSEMRRTMARLGERFGSLVLAGMADGTLRIVDSSLAAQMINAMINAAAEIERWVAGLDAGNVFELYALPLFAGLRSAPPAGAADAPPASTRLRRSATAA